MKLIASVLLLFLCVDAQNFATLIYSAYPTHTTPVYMQEYDPMSSNECNQNIFENEGLGDAQSVMVCTTCDANSPVYYMLGTYDFIPNMNSSQYIVTYMESTGSNESFPIIYEGDFKPWLFFSASPVKDPTQIPTIALNSDFVHKFFQTGYLDATTGIFTVLANHTTPSRIGENYYRIINFQYDFTNSRFFVFGSLDAGANFYVYEFGLNSGDSDANHPISTTLWKYSSVYSGIGWDEQTQKLVVVGGQYGTAIQYYFFEIDLNSNSLVVLNTWKLPNSNYEISIPDYPPPIVDVENSLFWVNIPYLTEIYVNINWVIFDISSGAVVPLPSSYCGFANNADAIAYVPSV